MDIYQSNTFRNDLSLLYFDDDPRFQERQKVKDQQFYISVFVAYLTIPSSRLENQPKKYRNTEQPQEKETSLNESRLQILWRQF